MSRSDIERRVIAILAGRASDEAFSGCATSGAATDLRQATEFLAWIHGVFGLGERLLSQGGEDQTAWMLTDHRMRLEVEADLQRLMAEARRLVASHEPAIRSLAALLLERRVAGLAEIDEALGASALEASVPDYGTAAGAHGHAGSSRLEALP